MRAPRAGNVSVIRVPRPSATGLSARDEPPCASTMPFAMASPRPGAFAAVAPEQLLPARTNFSKTCGSSSAGMPGPSSVTRSETDAGVNAASMTTYVSAGVCATALSTTIDECLLNQDRIGARPSAGRREVTRRLLGAAPPGSVDDALDDFTQIDPVAPQLERAGVDPGNRQEIAHHLVETLGSRRLMWPRRSAGAVVELVPVFEQARRRAEDGRQRRSKVVRDRSQQCIAHPFGLGRASRRHHLLRERGAVEGGRRSARRACRAAYAPRASSGAPQFIAPSADHAEGGARRVQRDEEPRHRGQRALSAPAGSSLRDRPARRRHRSGDPARYSGGHAARSTNSPSSETNTIAGRPRLEWISAGAGRRPRACWRLCSMKSTST